MTPTAPQPTRPRPAAPRLADHGVIGDRATAALVDATGTIDWYAPDGMDRSPSLYRLVDPSGGMVRVGLDRPDVIGEQSNDPNAPILATTLTARDAAFSVTDHLFRGRIVRVVTGLRGTSEVHAEIVPGWRFGLPRRVDRWSDGVAFGSLIVRGVDLDAPRILNPGDRFVVTISPLDDGKMLRSAPDLAGLTVGAAMAEQDLLKREWRNSLGRVELNSLYRAQALTSIRHLRLLTDRTSNALLRALTTSLPVRTGNERNIDERFAWLRDNADVTTLWEALGTYEWANSSRWWLHQRAQDEFPLAPAYQCSGEGIGSEQDAMLPGWQGHGPVRTGSKVGSLLDLGAIAQVSMVLDARDSWTELEKLGNFLADHGRRPDNGRWDRRVRPQRHVESALAVRAALRALIRTTQRRDPLDLVVVGWKESLNDLSNWLQTEGCFGRRPNAGWRRIGGTVDGDLGDDSSDASLLAHLCDPSDLPSLPDDVHNDAATRRDATLAQTIAQLSEDVLTHRHLAHVDDGFPPGQGADLWASFTLVRALCAADRWEEAHERMEALLPLLGPTGIGATHVDPASRDLRGNLAAAPTHVAVVMACAAFARSPH